LPFNELLVAIARQLQGDTRFQVIAQKLLNRSIGDRDWSAQEVCHLLNACQMMGSSRQFTTLCLLQERTRMTRRIEADDDWEDELAQEGIEGSDWLDDYYARPPTEPYESLSVYSWFKRWEKKRGAGAETPREKRKDKIVRLWPLYAPSEPGTIEHENWCRAKLLLHHPHRDRITLNIRQDTERWDAAYERCLTHCDHPIGEDTLPSGRGGHMDLSDSEMSEASHETYRDVEDFHLLAAQGPRDVPIDGDEFSRLGRRDIDISHDWKADAEAWGAGGLDARVAHLDEAKLLVSGPRQNPLTSATSAIRPSTHLPRSAQRGTAQGLRQGISAPRSVPARL
jgi:hypothetical protein